jgi:N-acylneuraminate cytidylyltransferase
MFFKYKIIIPARGGSKRIPKKNTINFMGIPLIAHTINFAKKNFSNEDIWVNTDDEDIADIANKYDVKVSIRPKNLGSDTATTADVLFFQCEEFNRLKINFDALITLQPTSPIRPKQLINNSIKFFEQNNRGSLATFALLKKKYGRILNNNFKPINYKPGQRSQDLASEYYESGLIYITKAEHLQKYDIITDDVYPYIYNGIESLVDIDDLDDLKFAEFVYKIKNNESRF